jgi:hypothetical protein
MSSPYKYNRINIDLRRGKVLELLSKGETNQSEIAKILGVSPALISIDIQFLKEQARDNLRTHLQERLPFEHARTMTGLNNLLKRTSNILDKTTNDPKLQLQVISVLANLYAGIMSLATDGGIIKRAMEEVELLKDIKRGKFVPSEEDREEDEEKKEEEDNILTEAEEDDEEENIPTEKEE